MNETSGVFEVGQVIGWCDGQLAFEGEVFLTRYNAALDAGVERYNGAWHRRLFKSLQITREDASDLVISFRCLDSDWDLHWSTAQAYDVRREHEKSRARILRIKALAALCQGPGVCLSLDDFNRLEQGRAHAAQEVRNQRGIT